MTRHPAWGVSLCMAIALTLGLALTAALGAPATGASAQRSKAVSPAKVTQLKRIATLNGQFISLSKRTRGCREAAADLRAATKLRKRALGGTKGASVARLRAKKRTMSKAVVRLSRGAKRCALTHGTTRVIAPVPGAAGGAGGAGAFSTQLRVPDLVGGSTFDLSQVLGGAVLPPVAAVVGVGELDGARCTSGTTACVGIDTVALSRSVDSLLDLNLSLGGLLDLDVGVLRSQVDRAIASGDLSSLVSVERVGDRVLRLVPRGPLAQLAGLARVPNNAIGLIQLPR
jgi:hypothetical protein